MKTYAFELSGEHESLPRCEALALVEAFSTRFSEIEFLEQCLIVEAEGLDVVVLGRRLAMTHRIIEVLLCNLVRRSGSLLQGDNSGCVIRSGIAQRNACRALKAL